MGKKYHRGMHQGRNALFIEDDAMSIELIKIDDKPIKRRYFMKDCKYKGPERRRNNRISFETTKQCVLLVCMGGAWALMFFYLG